MKKFFLFLVLSVFSCEAFADDDGKNEANLGILRAIIEEDFEEKISAFKPKISNRLIVEAAFDDNYQSTDRRNEFKESQGKIRLFTTVDFTKNLALNSYLKVERLDNISQMQRRSSNSRGGGDRAFENVGIFFEELNLDYDTKNYGIIAGKFNLNFGTAWRWDRGIWLREIAENYKEREKLGFGGVLHLGDEKKTGRYNFGFATFTNDTKNLDNSILVNRDSSNKSEGRPGDLRGFSSYIASLDVNFDFGKKFDSAEKLSYHFSYINLAVNEKFSAVDRLKIDNQKGFTLGMNYKYPVMNNLRLDGLLEYVEIKNSGGNSDVGDRYLSANVISKIYQNWLFILGYSQRQNLHLNQNGFDQNLTEISFGYEFRKNAFFDKFTVQAGYKNQRTDYHSSLETQNVLGVLARYYKNF